MGSVMIEITVGIIEYTFKKGKIQEIVKLQQILGNTQSSTRQ